MTHVTHLGRPVVGSLEHRLGHAVRTEDLPTVLAVMLKIRTTVQVTWKTFLHFIQSYGK